MPEATQTAAPNPTPTAAPAEPGAPGRAADGRFAAGESSAAPSGEPPTAAPAELDSDALAVIESAEAAGADVVRIGELDVPIEALQAAMDDPKLLKKLKRKIKAAGKEREVTFADAFDAVPKAEGWQKKMFEADQQKKQVAALVERMRADPMGAMEQILGSPEKIYEAMLKKLEYEGMTKEDRAKIDEERELRRKAKLADEYEQQKQAEAEAQAVEAAREQYQRSLTTALGEAGVKVSGWSIARAAGYAGEILASLPEGRALTQAEQDKVMRAAAEHVKGERERERASEVDGLEGDALLQHFGDDLSRKIARAYAARLRKAQGERPEPLPKPVGGREAEPRKPKRRVSIEEHIRAMQEKDREGAWQR